MDLTTDPATEAFREKVQGFLAEHLPADWRGIGALDAEAARRFTDGWRALLGRHGYLAPSWPEEYGGPGLTAAEQVVLVEEMERAGVPTGSPNDPFSIQMVGNTLLAWGTEEQKRERLPRILSGEEVWCQGYSEPDAGSDLANLSCRAELVGDEWVIHGQKIWTSCGHLANWIFLLARTGTGASRHQGITCLMVPMDQPGVEVRPIRMLTGEGEFCEVFFDGARCRRTDVVGEVGAGWGVAMTLLGYERGETAVVYPLMFRSELDRLVDLARLRGRLDDPVLRQRLAAAHTEVEVMRFLGLRTLTRFLAGHRPGPDAAVFKLGWTEYHQRLTELSLDVLGPDATVPSGRWPSDATPTDDVGAPPDSASWVGSFLVSRAGTIYAGSSEIQRSIIGEMVLGLPKEPRPQTRDGS